jgi:hypothetical protein
VVSGGVLADEQPLADLRVGEAVADEPRDLSFLTGERIPCLDTAFADPLAGGQQFALGARGEALDARACRRSSETFILLAFGPLLGIVWPESPIFAVEALPTGERPG